MYGRTQFTKMQHIKDTAQAKYEQTMLEAWAYKNQVKQ